MVLSHETACVVAASHTSRKGRSRRTLARTVTFRTSYDCKAGRHELCLPSSSSPPFL
ncbi:hypothetical protein BT69DRAFT_642012 [Atractiella rhizophila]|nr:hypothetical protein BT69DRAFT_642012 [Atractiella rhizophila]